MKKLLFIFALLMCMSLTWAQNVIFVKSGVTDGDVITVGSETGAAYTTLKEAVAHAAAGDIVKLTEDVTEAGTVSDPYGPCCVKLNGITIDGCGHKLRVTGMSGGYACSIYLMKGTVQNLDVSGGFRTLFSGGVSGDIVIDNCIVNAGGEAAYPFNTDAANINYSVTITNSTLYGWCSYTGDFKSVTISNTTFAQGTSSYAYFRPYSPTLLENVTFDNSGSEGYAVDARQDRIIFNNCNVGGTHVSTDNIASLLGSNSTSKSIIVEGTYETNAEGQITGGVYGGNLDQLNQVLAAGYVAMPLGTTPETYQVTPVYYVHFNAGGGTGTHGDSIVLRSAPTFTVPANTQFTYGTYTFQSWNSKIYGAGTDIAVGSTMTLSSDTTLYAKWNLDFVAKIGSTTYGTLQAAVDAAYDMTGDVTIDVVKDIEGAFTVVREKAGLNLTINGNDHTIKGQIFIFNYQGQNNRSLTIENINFTDEGYSIVSSTDALIYLPDPHGTYWNPAQATSWWQTNGINANNGAVFNNYVQDVTIRNCTFTIGSTSVVAVKSPSSQAKFYGVELDNITVSGGHSMAQFNAPGKFNGSDVAVRIENCNYTVNTHNGINITGGDANNIFEINNNTLTGLDGYALRIQNGGANKTANLSGNTFSSNEGIILKSNDAVATVNISSGNYNGPLDKATGTAANQNFVLTGGTYNQPVATVQSYCAEGYMAIDEDPTPGYCTVRRMHVVSFDNNGGTGTMASEYVNPVTGEYIVPACTFTNGDWAFDKWNTKADGTGTDLVENDPMTLTSDTTLYAIWRGVAKIGDTHYTTLNAAAAAVPVGTPTTIEILTNLNFYDIAGGNLTNKTITFTGVATDTLTLTNSAHAQTTASGADLTFENITLKNDMTSDVYRGIIHLNKLTINNCEILGFMMGYAENFICNNCTFTKTGKYHMWTYGSNCTFNSCTFNSLGNSDCKAINVYKEGTLSQPFRVVTFNDCAFNSTPAVTTLDNSAIQINSALCCFVVYINNCTVNGFINNSSSVAGYENLVNNKNTSVATTLYIDGTQILKQGSCDPVAKIGDTYYQTLQTALDDAFATTGNVTIEIISDEINTYSVIREKNGLNLTIEGNDHNLDGQLIINGMGLGASGTGTVTIQNLNFNGDNTNFYSGTDAFVLMPKPADIPSPYNTNTYNYANNVTIDNCDFTSTSASLDVVGLKVTSGAGAYNLAITNCTGDNLHSLAQLTGTTGLTFTNDTITNSESFVNISGGAGTGTISNCKYVGINPSDGYAVRKMEGSGAIVTLNNNDFTAYKVLVIGKNNKGNTQGSTNVESGVYNGLISWEAADTATAIFSFTGGTFDQPVATVQNWCAPGYAAFDNGDGTCTVEKARFLVYVANGGTGTMDTVIVRLSAPDTVAAACAFTNGTMPFISWNESADGTGTSYNVGDPVTVSADTTRLYAIWQGVAMIGYMPFPSIQAAVDYANDNLTGAVTIDLVQNTSEVVKILQKDGISITLNGNDSTLTGQIFISNRQGDPYPAYTGTYTESNTVTIDNLNMKYDPAYFEGTSDEDGLIYFCKNCAFGNVLNYSHNVTISNCDFDADGSSQSVYGISSRAGTVWNLNIENCTAKNAAGLATLQSAPQFEVTNCSTEDVKYGIRIVNNDGPMTVTGNNFTADEVGILVTGMTTGATINFANDTVNAPKAFELANSCTSGTLDITSGMYIGDIDDNSTSDFFNISGGTYSEDVSGEPCAPGYAAFANGTVPETWTVTKAWFLYYDKNEAGASGTMDTLFVKQSGTDADRTLVVDNCNFTWLPDHSFLAWNTKADALGDTLHPGDNITLISDTTLYVIWQEGYTIFYHNNGGTGTIPNQYKAVDETITLSDGSAFSKTDSTLYWWNTAADESGTGYALGAEYSGNANLDLYAAWRLNLTMTMDSTDVVCYGEGNGTDTVKIIGGEMPFKLVLSGTEDRTITNIMTRTYVFENLEPGSYVVTLTDTLNKDIITGTFTIAQPDTLIVETMTVPVKPCPLMGVGEYNVSMTTTGGNGDNHFAWTGAVDVDAMATVVIPGADDRDSTYTVTVTVTDKKNCTATRSESFAVSPVIADDATVHSNTKMTIDTIKQGIMQGCDTIIRDFGTPNFAFTNPAIDVNILDTIYNDIPTNYPDSIFPVGYSTIIWTAVDTCGHEVTGEQIIYIYHYPCPSVDDYEGNTYNSVRVGCLCWTDRNLVSTKYSNGSHADIPNLMSYVSEQLPDAADNVSKFGYLYDWYAAADTATNSVADIEATYAAGKHVQGVCPNGWYLPTDEDFKTLEAFDTKDLRSTDYWVEGGGTNATGFNAVPGGFYNCATGRYEDASGNAYYWSCHPVFDKATGAMIDYICEKIYNSNEYSRCNGFSVRCVLIVGE